METSLGNPFMTTFANISNSSHPSGFSLIAAELSHSHAECVFTPRRKSHLKYLLIRCGEASMLQNVIKSLRRGIFMEMTENINSNFHENNNPRFHLSFIPFILV